jgi:hypothetical protein
MSTRLSETRFACADIFATTYSWRVVIEEHCCTYDSFVTENIVMVLNMFVENMHVHRYRTCCLVRTAVVVARVDATR